jgi:hypothetical protein
LMRFNSEETIELFLHKTARWIKSQQGSYSKGSCPLLLLVGYSALADLLLGEGNAAEGNKNQVSDRHSQQEMRRSP